MNLISVSNAYQAGLLSLALLSVGHNAAAQPASTSATNPGDEATTPRAAHTSASEGATAAGASGSPRRSATRTPEARSGAYRLLIAGPTEGLPSAGKTATLTTLYSLSGLGVVATGLFGYLWVDANAKKKDTTAAGACQDLSSDTCSALLDARRDVRSYGMWTSFSGAAAATAFVGGLLSAHYWGNVTVSGAVTQGGGALGVRVLF